jgi:N-acetylglucosaminyl transferase component (Gpi1)
MTAQWITNALYWLDHWPLGLKLNTELSAFLCASLSQLVNIWEGEINGSSYLILTGLFRPAS